ncbi:unnamed protein product [Boreogadus saida]
MVLSLKELMHLVHILVTGEILVAWCSSPPIMAGPAGKRLDVLNNELPPFLKYLQQDNGRKDKAWHLIAAVLGVDADMCKARWKALRDAFVKNRKKGIPSGSAGGTQKDWKYSEIMSFVLPHLQPRSSRSNVGSGTPQSDRSEGPVAPGTEIFQDWLLQRRPPGKPEEAKDR